MDTQNLEDAEECGIYILVVLPNVPGARSRQIILRATMCLQ